MPAMSEPRTAGKWTIGGEAGVALVMVDWIEGDGFHFDEDLGVPWGWGWAVGDFKGAALGREDEGGVGGCHCG